ncbi:MAG: ApaG domain [Alphaproteobacteria bacterium]|nr:ApaG domain [Alphaproteobacteria bacterium]
MYSDEQYATNLDDDILVSAYLKPSDDTATDGSFCWDYFFRFENNSNNDIVLLSKNLSVIDDKGKMTSVNYDGFRGQLPELIPGDEFEDDGYITSKTSAILKGFCTIRIGNKIKKIELPIMNLIANDNNARIVN